MNLNKYQTAGKKKEINKDVQQGEVIPKDQEWTDGKIVKIIKTGTKTQRVVIGVYYVDAKGNKVKGLKPVEGTIPRKRQTGGLRRYQVGGGRTHANSNMFDPNFNANFRGLSGGRGAGGNINFNPRMSIGNFENSPQSKLTMGANLSRSGFQHIDPTATNEYGTQGRTTLGARGSFQSPIGNRGLIGGASVEGGKVLGGHNNNIPVSLNDSSYGQVQAGLGYYPRNSNLGIKGNIGYGTEGSVNPGASYGATANYGPASFNVSKNRQGWGAGFGLSLPLGTSKKQTGGMYGSNTMSAAGQGSAPQLGTSSTIVGQETDPALQEQRMQALAASGQSLGQEGTELSSEISQQVTQDKQVAEQMGEQAGMQSAQEFAQSASAIEGAAGAGFNLAKRSGIFNMPPAGSQLITDSTTGLQSSLAPGATLPAGSVAAGKIGGAGVGTGLSKFATSGAGMGTIASLAGSGISMLSDDGDPTHSNVGEYTGSILGSAGSGAAIGSYLGPGGTLIGGIGGALYGAGKQFFGTKAAKKAEEKAEKSYEAEQKSAHGQKIGSFNKRISSLYGSHLSSARAGNLAQKTVSGQNLGRNVMYKEGGFKGGLMMGMPRYGYNY